MKREFGSIEAVNHFIADNPDLIIPEGVEELITEPFASAGVMDMAGRPIEIVAGRHTVLRHLGHRTLRILDIGVGDKVLGMYLASEGHDVTVTDINETCVDWQNEAAGKLGLAGFRAINQDILSLDEQNQYDIIVASHVLHFLEVPEIEQAVGNMQQATKPGGLNILLNYSSDNPDCEKLPPRNLKTLYDSPVDLAKLYPVGWHIVDSRAGVVPRHVQRQMPDGRPFAVLPSAIEVVMRKNNPNIPFAPSPGDMY